MVEISDLNSVAPFPVTQNHRDTGDFNSFWSDGHLIVTYNKPFPSSILPIAITLTPYSEFIVSVPCSTLRSKVTCSET